MCTYNTCMQMGYFRVPGSTQHQPPVLSAREKHNVEDTGLDCILQQVLSLDVMYLYAVRSMPDTKRQGPPSKYGSITKAAGVWAGKPDPGQPMDVSHQNDGSMSQQTFLSGTPHSSSSSSTLIQFFFSSVAIFLIHNSMCESIPLFAICLPHLQSLSPLGLAEK